MLKSKRTVVCQMMLLCSLVFVPFSAYAGTISLSPAGGGAFTVLASGFNAPAGFHLFISYDASRLSNPRVVKGSLVSGGMFIANPNVAGSVQLATVSGTPVAGSGAVATITFDQTGDSAGTLSVSGTVIDMAGKNLPVSFSGWSAGDGSTPIDTTATGTTPGTTSNPNTFGNPAGAPTGGSPTATPFMPGGTLTMPSDDSAARERKEVTVQPQSTPQEGRENAVPAPVDSDAAVASEAQATKKKAQGELPRPIQSVLEKFRLFAGEKTPQNLMALFDPEQGATMSQSPTVCIADGRSSVQLLVTKVAGDKAPNFGFNNAHSLSVRQAGDGEWQIEVVPAKGALKASISLLTDGVQQEIPLTVSPQANIDLDKSGTVTEADFQLFLKTRGTDAAPTFDLNGDGKRDYQDDYIFTANYLAMKAGAATAKKEVPAPKRP